MSAFFKDAAGREWTVAITIGAAREIRDKLGVDLLQPEQGDPPLLTRLGTDEMLLAEVILCLIADQIEQRQLTERDIRNLFDGRTLLAAHQAFYRELVDFFQGRGRGDRATAVQKQDAMIQAAVAVAESRVKAIDIKAILASATPGTPSGNSPASSESIPAG